MSQAARTLIIGIDGGTFDVFRPLMAAGRMPALARLVQDGAHGVLLSTSPPITGPAWRSFATGCNPGKHGIIDFVRLDPATRRVHVTEVTYASLPTLWGELSAAGRKVAVMGVPMTYPVQPVNGILLTGLMTPPGSGEYAHPAGLAEELRARGLRWLFSEGENANAHRPGPYVDEVIEDMRARVDTALYVLEREQPDFAAFVFGATDPLQHQFMDVILDERHPEHGAVTRFYEELDRQISRLLAWAGDDTLIMVMSDHGFGPLRGFIHLNNWLLEKGYLVLRGDPLTRVRQGLHRLGYTPENLYTLARRLGLDMRRRLNRGRVYSIARLAFLSFENVDWERTTAYSLGHIGQVYLRHGAAETLREELRAELLDMRHPATGEPLIERVFAREEVYSGPLVGEAPDLILHPAGFEHVAFGESEFASNLIVGPALHRGHHRMEGMLAMKGPGIRRGAALADRRIEDIMPTALYSLDVAAPSYLDGEVIAEAYEAEHLARRPARTVEREMPGPGGDAGRGYSEEEEELLRDRLRKLGYLA
jgi:predicted AlkP superfamily phosphohydrolase/phosphomutase